MNAGRVSGIVSGHVTCIDRFLSCSQCAALLGDLEYAWWWPSPLVHRRSDGTLVSGTSHRRTSMTTSEEWLARGSIRILRRIEQRLSDELGIDSWRLEMWQATRYRVGQRFDEHHDAGFFGGDPWGERTTTTLIYLDTPRVGGATRFPRLGQQFQPVAGRLLVWPNLLADGSVDQTMRHAAGPARSRKTTLTTWAREKPTRAQQDKER